VRATPACPQNSMIRVMGTFSARGYQSREATVAKEDLHKTGLKSWKSSALTGTHPGVLARQGCAARVSGNAGGADAGHRVSAVSPGATCSIKAAHRCVESQEMFDLARWTARLDFKRHEANLKSLPELGRAQDLAVSVVLGNRLSWDWRTGR
jgi:hypothetical protein